MPLEAVFRSQAAYPISGASLSPAAGLPTHMLGTDSMSSRKRKLCAKRNLDALIRESAPAISHALQPYWRLVNVVRASSRMLTPVPNSGSTCPESTEGFIRALARMAKHRRAWRRQPFSNRDARDGKTIQPFSNRDARDGKTTQPPFSNHDARDGRTIQPVSNRDARDGRTIQPETWIAPDASPFVQFPSLVSHLFDEFPVPTFMAPVWCAVDKPWEIDMYLHLAAGRSIRQFKLPLNYPVNMTKRAAQWWMKAPDDAHPILAYRWAQVRALGGDSRLANILIRTPALMIPTRHEDFWESVIRFLIDQSPISAVEITNIVQFIDQQRFQPGERVWGPGAGQQPLQPDFSIKGRSLMSLRRHMANWRDDVLEKLPAIVPKSSDWVRTSIAPFRHKSGGILWTIDELLSDQELRVEGGIMRHCVASYIHECARRRTSIWSMKMHRGERRVRTLTIEVLPYSRIICQAKGKRNASPKGVAEEMLKQWAEREGLTFPNSA
jgi:hypothetical protein